MAHPDADQITCGIRDFENALATPASIAVRSRLAATPARAR